MNQEVRSIFEKYEDPIVALGLATREYLLTSIKNVVEQPDHSANIIGYGLGKGYKGLVCTLIPSKKGIKIGFYKGVELPDPGKLLSGSGKLHRFVEIKSGKDIENPDLKALLRNAINSCKSRIVAIKRHE